MNRSTHALNLALRLAIIKDAIDIPITEFIKTADFYKALFDYLIGRTDNPQI